MFNCLYADVIGRVVERDALKEKDVNGKKSKLIDITLEDSELVSISMSISHIYFTASVLFIIIDFCLLIWRKCICRTFRVTVYRTLTYWFFSDLNFRFFILTISIRSYRQRSPIKTVNLSFTALLSRS